MINNIYFDLDECLLYSSVGCDPDQDHFFQTLDAISYYTIVRPCANRLFKFAQSLVGLDHVYILTASLLEYASAINKHYNFVHSSKLLTREDISKFYTSKIPHNAANKNNVLIDNLPSRYNETKTGFVGIMNTNRYLQTPEYYGVNYPDDTFETDVESFLIMHHASRVGA